ncbi:hypothetical protein BT63DRAFT_453093 [Microthyrium microscopicum]|uniref:Ecp2 effector protein domain-containing protein n=1 Tax=Microthyrium microscopicum TaxID=703497 RepID=A0A6A6UH09_9PEZI|nr:hypothetical protein BT63DRAFT_453093 [Microthyrium microscopicum]
MRFLAIACAGFAAIATAASISGAKASVTELVPLRNITINNVQYGLICNTEQLNPADTQRCVDLLEGRGMCFVAREQSAHFCEWGSVKISGRVFTQFGAQGQDMTTRCPYVAHTVDVINQNCGGSGGSLGVAGSEVPIDIVAHVSGHWV